VVLVLLVLVCLSVRPYYYYYISYYCRRGLTACPTLESEDQLRLLNFQHNTIRTIENVDGLRRLIFLDFYDNQLEHIDNLAALRSLRVLMLGKNR